MNKRRMIVPLACALLGGSLAACSNGGSGGDKTAEGGTAATPPKEPVELTVFYAGGDDGQERFDQIYGQYLAEKFPNFKIRYLGTQKGMTVGDVLATRQPIDVVYSGLSSMQTQLIDTGLAYDIDPMINKFKFDLSTMEPSSIDLIRQVSGGKLYGLPEYIGTVKLVYNKSLFDKFAVPYPKDGMTWDEAYELAKLMTRKEGGVQYRGMSIIFDHYIRFNQLSAGFVDPKTEKSLFVSDGKWQRVVDNAVRFYKIPGNEVNAQTISFAAQQGWFEKDQTLAMYVTGSAVDRDSMATMDFDFAKLPSFSDLPGVGAQPNPNFFTVSAISQHKDEAFQVVAYLASKEYQIKRVGMGREPSVKDPAVLAAFGQDKAMFKGKNIKSYFPDKYAAPMIRTPYDDAAKNALLAEMNKLAIGTTADTNTALRAATEAADKAIAEQKAMRAAK